MNHISNHSPVLILTFTTISILKKTHTSYSIEQRAKNLRNTLIFRNSKKPITPLYCLLYSGIFKTNHSVIRQCLLYLRIFKDQYKRSMTIFMNFKIQSQRL